MFRMEGPRLIVSRFVLQPVHSMAVLFTFTVFMAVDILMVKLWPGGLSSRPGGGSAYLVAVAWAALPTLMMALWMEAVMSAVLLLMVCVTEDPAAVSKMEPRFTALLTPFVPSVDKT
jgi:hypothetical protein